MYTSYSQRNRHQAIVSNTSRSFSVSIIMKQSELFVSGKKEITRTCVRIDQHPGRNR